MKYLAILFVACSVISCGEYEPEVQFTEPIKGAKINLIDYLDETFSLIQDNDTIEYSITFDAETKENLITQKEDTIFIGTAIKRRELILLTRELRKGKFGIYAIKISDTTITGFNTEYYQNRIMDSLIYTSKHSGLIKDTTEHTTIKANRRSSKHLFRDVIALLPPEKIIREKPIKNPKPDIRISATEISPTPTALVKSTFPNPFTDVIHIEMSTEGSFTFEFHDHHGKLISTHKKTGQNFEFDLTNAPKGIIFISVVQINNSRFEQLQTLKL